jgi:hypothetical protein
VVIRALHPLQRRLQHRVEAVAARRQVDLCQTVSPVPASLSTKEELLDRTSMSSAPMALAMRCAALHFPTPATPVSSTPLPTLMPMPAVLLPRDFRRISSSVNLTTNQPPNQPINCVCVCVAV